MLQTSVITPDATPATGAGASPSSSASREKDAAANLEANFSAFYSQMMSVLPGATAQTALPAPAPAPARSSAAPIDSAPAAGRSGPATAARTSGTTGAAAASSGPAPDATAGAAKAQVPAPGPAGADTATQAKGQGTDRDPAPAAAPAAAAASAGQARPAPAKDAAPAARPEAAADPVGTVPATAIPTPTAPAEAEAAAQKALAEAYPGGRLQVQVDDGATLTATAKAPLTEFLTPIPQANGAQAGTAAQATPAAPVATPAAQAAGAAQQGLAAALQAPLATTPAAMAAWPANAPQGGTAPVAATGTSATAASAAGAQALGAGAMPGAAGAVRVTPTTATEQALPTRQETPLAQVDGTIRFLVKNQDQSAELQLHPESLGRLQIKLKVEGNVVHAKVWASEAATVPLLNDQKALLEASLKNQGLSLGSFDLQHGRRGDQAPLPGQDAAPATVGAVTGAARPAAETAALAESTPVRNGRIEIVA